MEVFKCDKCGKYFDDYPSFKVKDYETIFKRIILIDNNNHKIEYDLCQDCVNFMFKNNK